MQILRVETISVPDNDNRPVDVIPIPQQSFEARASYEVHEELIRLIAEVFGVSKP